MNNPKAPTRQEEQLAWHYTISDRAEHIVASEFIYAATAGVPAILAVSITFRPRHGYMFTHWAPETQP